MADPQPRINCLEPDKYPPPGPVPHIYTKVATLTYRTGANLTLAHRMSETVLTWKIAGNRP